MPLALLTLLTMVAFAANSVLNRLAVDSGAIGPTEFAVLRVASGAVVLTGLTWARGRRVPLLVRGRWAGALALSVYMVGFSLAYQSLDAGLGALILFGVVQMAMFAWTALRGAPATIRQLSGAAIAFAGLIVVLWPGGAAAVSGLGAGLMAAAGVGWAAYTLLGKAETDALAGTAANFVAAVPPVLLVALLAGGSVPSLSGVALAMLSGAVTSGLGYATWYAILPRIETGLAAVLQSSVPVIALAAGVVLLGEAASLRLLIGAALVLGGILLAVRR